MSNLTIKVTPNAKKTLIKKEGNIIKVYLQVPAIEGKANKELIRVLAEYYHVRKSDIEIIKGLKSRNKTISIRDCIS